MAAVGRLEEIQTWERGLGKKEGRRTSGEIRRALRALVLVWVQVCALSWDLVCVLVWEVQRKAVRQREFE
jgi:hypothetical protein